MIVLYYHIAFLCSSQALMFSYSVVFYGAYIPAFLFFYKLKQSL